MATEQLTATACTHCSLPVPAGLVEAGAARQFCCQGCRAAYEIIQGCDLGTYYALRERAGAAPSPARSKGRWYAEFDDPTFRRLYVKDLPSGLKSVELMLEGVHCAACVWLVEKLPVVAAGVVEARLDLRRATVRVVWDESRATLSEVARALDSLGYAPHPARNGSARAIRRLDDRTMLIRLGVAGACAGNVMLLALALYAGLFSSMEPVYREFFRWLSMGISLVSIAWPGSVFFKSAWAALRTRTLHLDVPIALGLGAGAIWGAWNTVRGTGEIYFDSLSVLVFALLAGRWIQHRQQRSSADSVELLFSLTPSSVRLVRGDAVIDVPLEAVSTGDTVEVLAGDSIPADGSISQGQTVIDQSLLTGESVPVAAAAGDAVHAGSINLGGRIRVLVKATGEATRVGRLLAMVEESSRRRAPIVRMADRIAGWFVAAMLILAAGTAAVWAWLDPSRAIDNAAALLIVTCPCALGLATPLAITVAVGRAARRGILIKGGDSLQALASRRGTILLDKTGTITEAKTRLVRWVGPEELKPVVAAVEAGSSHLIARALAEAGRDAGPLPLAMQVRSASRGIEGVVGGRRIMIGSAAWVRETDGSGAMRDVEREMAAAGLTPVLIAVNGRIAAAAGVGDPVRAGAKDAVDGLRRMGWRVGVLSGDHPDVVAAVGRHLGLEPRDVIGGATPEAKREVVEAIAKHEFVVMVGDGVNDAAVMAAASVGIAVHGGAEASLAAADVYLSRPGLGPIVELARASRRTMGVIRRNLAASLFYNALAAGLAVTGLINPLLAAVLMPLSSLTVLTLSYRCRTFGGPTCP